MSIENLLFQTPFWLPTGIVGAGVGLFVYANARQEWKLRTAGMALVLAGILLSLVSYFVDTDLEKVRKRSQQFVAALDQRDWVTFKNLLDPNTTFAFYRGQAELASGAEKTADDIGLKSVGLLSLEAQQTDSLITVTVSVLSTQEMTMLRPLRTNWQLDWQQSSAGWGLRSIRFLSGDSVRAEDVNRRLKAP